MEGLALADIRSAWARLGCGPLILAAILVAMAVADLFQRYEVDDLERKVDRLHTAVTDLQQSVAELHSATRPPTPREELGLWAKYASLTAQLSRASGSSAQAVSQNLNGFLNDATERFGLSQEDLDQLLERGNRLGWSRSPECSPPVPMRWTSWVTRPVFREPLRPDYPPGAQENGFEGTMILEAVIDREGTVVGEVKVLKGGPSGFTESAIASVAASRWVPAHLCGRPIDLPYSVTVSFSPPQSRASKR